MKVLVSAHRLQIGGTQVNSIELAANLRDRFNHDIIFWAQSGPMTEVVKSKHLNFIPAPEATVHPSFARMKALRKIVRMESPDLIHAWDWWQGLDAYFGVHLPWKVPLVISDMMMDITRVLPKSLLTTFGTPQVAERARAAGWRSRLLLPPVDVEHNAPGVVDAAAFEEKFGDPNALTVVTVARLSHSMKLDGLVRAIDAIRQLDQCITLKLIIVGGGTERGRLEEMAHRTNVLLQREAVVLTGPIVDPRMAYAAADIVIGMGGSALRGMAFAKPVIVVGENGFARVFLPDNATTFYQTGLYGKSDGVTEKSQITAALAMLATNYFDREALGKFSRSFVMQHHSIDVIGNILDDVYRSARYDRHCFRYLAWDTLRTLYTYFRERRYGWPSRDLLQMEDTAGIPDEAVKALRH